MSRKLLNNLENQLGDLEKNGLYKNERVIVTPQQACIKTDKGDEVLNFCANNYLGLSNNSDLKKAAAAALESHGFGLSSVRFICGTQDIHKDLEQKISDFLRTDETILYSSCFDANGGLFETLLGAEDAIISDELNHASIIDGVRLCKAKRYRYKNNDMADLEVQLKESKGARYRLIATDGVFSMDGVIADLKGVCNLADKYDALVMVDDSHAVGFVGENGRGTPEYCGVEGRVDIITGTLGKALGGATGGYTSGRKPIINWLRQRSRPYLFSNSMAPPFVAAAVKTLDIVSGSADLRQKLNHNTEFFRKSLTEAGFTIVTGVHPIVPLMLFDEKLAAEMSSRLLEKGIYAIGFSFPVVPMGKARIRFQMSAAHNRQHLEKAVDAICALGREFGVIK